MSSPRAALFASLVFLSACGAVEEDAGSSLDSIQSEIVGGTVATGDPAVVSLARSYDGVFYSYCTGTLIAPRTVLTAAHCVNSHSNVFAVVATDVTQPTSSVQIAQQFRHPSYSSGTLTADIGILRLTSPFLGVTPIPLNTQAPTVGQTIRHVGFGITDAQTGAGSGTKREVTFTIRELQPSKLESGASGQQTCSGDSGGPGFVVMPGTQHEVVAGVVSHGDSYCAQQGWDTRVDAYAAWVQKTMAMWEGPTCAEDGLCRTDCAQPDIDCVCVSDNACNALCPDLLKDPDCDKNCVANGYCAQSTCPYADPDCGAEGESCSTDVECELHTCVGDPQHASWYCSRPCTSDAECTTEGMECTDGACRWTQLPTARVDEPCTDQTYCLGGTVCTGPSADSLTCRIPCNGSDSSCPSSGQRCKEGVTGAYYCVKTVAPIPAAGTTSPVVASPAPPPQQQPASGCSASGSAPLWLGALGLLFVLFGRRRAVLRAAPAAALAALIVQGCGPSTISEAPAQSFATAERKIVGGTTDFGDPEVFMLVMEFSDGSNGLCSSTLIGARTLATAAHCVDNSLSASGASLSRVYAMNKTSVSSATQGDWYLVVDKRLHPNWVSNGTSLEHDIAMVLLDRAPPVQRKPWNTASLVGFAGRPVRAIGYGITSSTSTDSGTKRQVTLAINGLDSDHIYLGDGSGKGICHGDSGGPSFHTFSDGVERLVGIHSYDGNGQCTSGADIRIDAYQGFVNQWLLDKEGPQCSNDGQCKSGCSPVDNDCYCLSDGTCNPLCRDLLLDPDCPPDCAANGVCATQACPAPDTDCVPEGEACTTELVCRNRVCLGDDQHSYFYCSRPCTTSNECPQGMECVAGANVCRYIQLPTASYNQPCTPGGTYCTGNTVCTGPLNGGGTYCEQVCATNDECGGVGTCDVGVGGHQYCQELIVQQAQPVLLPRAKLERQKLASACAAVGGQPLGMLLLALGALLRVRRR